MLSYFRDYTNSPKKDSLPFPSPSSTSQAQAAVLSYPRVLEKSLLQDIGPRLNYLRDRGLQIDGGTLSKVFEVDEVAFAVDLVGGSAEDYEEYCM